MKTNEYIYGDVEVPEIPSEIIMRRVELLDEHMMELLQVPYQTRDITRVAAVIKARSFWANINNNDV